jgi:hypothetical protein
MVCTKMWEPWKDPLLVVSQGLTEVLHVGFAEPKVVLGRVARDCLLRFLGDLEPFTFAVKLDTFCHCVVWAFRPTWIQEREGYKGNEIVPRIGLEKVCDRGGYHEPNYGPNSHIPTVFRIPLQGVLMAFFLILVL